MKIGRILIGIDDSKFAEHAAEYGFELARLFKAEIGLVSVVEPVITESAGGTDFVTGIPAENGGINDLELFNIQNELSDSIIDRTTKKFGEGLSITHFSEFGPTAEGIVNCSKEFDADIIVIGTHSRTGLDRLLMGSVAEHVVRYADVPVLVVPLKEG